jgi:hypothetical protein
MKVRMAYCSACDRNVRVVVKPEALEQDPNEVTDPGDLVCLEHGEKCTGDMCPLFDVPSKQMRENLRRLLDESDVPTLEG